MTVPRQKSAAKPAPLDPSIVDEHEARLRTIANTIFYGASGDRLEIDPARTKVMLGLYADARRFPAKSRKVKPFKDVKASMRMRYLLAVDEQPLSIIANPDREPGEIDYIVEDWTPSGRSLPIPLLHWSTLADFSEDNEDELLRCGLPRKWAAAFGNMSRDTREAFKKPIAAIIDKPPALRDVKPVKFLRMLAAHGTYDATTGAYYAKWREPESKDKHRIFPASLTEEFIKKNASEVHLGSGRDYLLLASDLSFQLFQIERRDDGEIDLHELLGGYDTHHAKVYPKPARTVVLFHSVDGERETRHRSQVIYRVNEADPQRLLLDPRGMVEAVAGGKPGGELLELNDSHDWFVEMCIAYFPRQFYTIDFHASPLQPNPDALELLKKEMDATVRMIMDQQGEIGELSPRLSAERRAEIESLLGQPGTVVFAQGLKVGTSSRLVAVDQQWVYFRDLQSEAVYAVHLFDFVHNYRIGVIAADVYESTRGMIPLLGVLFVTATVGFGAGALAGAGLTGVVGGQLVRKVVGDLTVGELSKMAVKRVIRFMGPAIAAYMTKLVTTFFIYVEGDERGAAKRWKAFAEGFFEGYVKNTLYDQFYRKLVMGTLTKGPKEYRAYLMVKRVYSAIDKAREIIDTLEAELDEASVQRGLKLFENAMQHFVQGAVLIASSLYFTQRVDVVAILEGLGDQPGTEAPEDEVWDLECSAQIAQSAKKLREQLVAIEVDDFIYSLRKSAPLNFGVAALYFYRDSLKLTLAVAQNAAKLGTAAWARRPNAMKEMEKKIGRTLTNPTVLKVLGGVLLASGIVHELATGGKGTKAVVKGGEAAVEGMAEAIDLLEPLLKELATQWPGSTEERARVHGQLTGGLLGAIMFNRFLFGTGKEKKAAKQAATPHIGQEWIRLGDSPILGSSLQRNLKIGMVGPILKVIFKRYLSLYQQLRKHGWPQATDRTEEELGRLLSVLKDVDLKQMEDQNFERLSLFRSKEETIAFSLSELVQTLFRLRTMVAHDLAAYLEMRYKKGDVDPKRFLPDEFETLINAAEALGLPDLVAKYGPQLFVVMSTQVYLALSELSAALEALFTPFTQRSKSWMFLLRELGIDVGDLDAALEELKAAENERLSMFKATAGAGGAA